MHQGHSSERTGKHAVIGVETTRIHLCVFRARLAGFTRNPHNASEAKGGAINILLQNLWNVSVLYQVNVFLLI